MSCERRVLCAGACRYTRVPGCPGKWRCPAHGHVHACPGPTCYASIDHDHPHIRICTWTGVHTHAADLPVKHADVSISVIRKSPITDHAPLFHGSIRYLIRPDVRAIMETVFWNKLDTQAARAHARSAHIHAFPRDLPLISDGMVARLVASISQYPISVRADEYTRHDEVALILINLCDSVRVPAWVRLLVPCYGLVIPRPC